MVTVIGVRFKKAGKVYYFDPSDVWPNPGDYVVVETARGVELGEVVTGAREVEDSQIVQPLKKVVRMAVEEDVRRMEYNEKREKEAYHIAQEKIASHKLDMKLVDVEYTFDNSKVIFYFTANGRVDFRDLVKDLASVFKMRIELRQIGVRDEAKMLGGLGSCGRQICCDAFLGDFQPVSIKMAKEQNLSLNPTKISGQCGRLMCCLKYEQDYYEASLKKLPKIGRECVTPDGVGIVSDINVIREKVRVRVRTPEDAIEIREYALEEVQKPTQNENGQHGTGEVAKQKQLEAARRAARMNRASGAPAGNKTAAASEQQGEAAPANEAAQAAQAEQEQQRERNKRRRIASKNKSKQMSTEQFIDKMNFERTESDEKQTMNTERPKGGRRERGERKLNEGAQPGPSPQKQEKPKDTGFFAGQEAIRKSEGSSVRPGDPMNS